MPSNDGRPYHGEMWCFAWFAAPLPETGVARAAMDSAMWTSGETITISFMDGNDQQKALVKRVASEWIDGLANLHFSWMDPPDTDIRISFANKGSWSVIGTTCRNVPKDKPTMNFDTLKPGISPEAARRVILHEFGHALGLVHEHLNANATIPWNRPNVVADLSGPPHAWPPEQIEKNMFATLPPNDAQNTAFDRRSIMMYVIPRHWTTDGSWFGLNFDLSDTDRDFIRRKYP